MSKPASRSEDFKLENVRLSYPSLFRPRKTEDNGKVKLQYEATLLWPKVNEPLMAKSVKGESLNVGDVLAKIAIDQWGDKAVEWIQTGLIKKPFKDGDGTEGIVKKTGERKPGYAGHRFLRAWSSGETDNDRRPECFGDKVGADNKLIKLTDPAVLYPGCYVHAVINAFTYDHPTGGKGISFGLTMVQFAKDGDRLGGTGGADPNSFFAPVGGAAATAGADTSKGAGGLFA